MALFEIAVTDGSTGGHYGLVSFMELAAHRGDHPIGLPPNGSTEISPCPAENKFRPRQGFACGKTLVRRTRGVCGARLSLCNVCSTGGHLWTGIPYGTRCASRRSPPSSSSFAGIFAAYYIAKLPRLIKGVLDVVLTLPLVLPPTVVGYLLLRVLGPKRVIGAWVLETFGVKLVMTWWSPIFATTVVIFPLMYRTVRGAFEAFDETLAYSGQTLGLSNTYIFWRIRMPCCRQGVLAGTVLAFARALGEYGATSMIAGYTPGKTATISTTVYQLWQTNNDALAYRWVAVNIVISAVVLLAVNMLERRDLLRDASRARRAKA